MPPRSADRSPTRPTPWDTLKHAWTTAVVADAAVVVVFATIGRASHDEGLRLAGVWHTAWPFLVGTALALAWAAYAKDDPRTASASGSGC